MAVCGGPLQNRWVLEARGGGTRPRGAREPNVWRDRSKQAGTHSGHPVEASEVAERAMGVAVGDDGSGQGRAQVWNTLDLAEGSSVEVDQLPGSEWSGGAGSAIPVRLHSTGWTPTQQARLPRRLARPGQPSPGRLAGDRQAEEEERGTVLGANHAPTLARAGTSPGSFPRRSHPDRATAG
jgi:hypothetical protein